MASGKELREIQEREEKGAKLREMIKKCGMEKRAEHYHCSPSRDQRCR